MDLKIQGTLGLTQRDVKAVSDIDGVELAEGSYSTDVMSGEDDARKVLHLESIGQNLIYLSDRRKIPEKSGEIFLDKPFLLRAMDIRWVIHTLKEGGDSELLKKTDYTVVGLGRVRFTYPITGETLLLVPVRLMDLPMCSLGF